MAKSIVEELYEEIQKKNAEKGAQCLPHSDEFIPRISAVMGIKNEQVRQILKILINAHMIFSFEITHQDAVRNIPRVEGYVVTDLNILRKLKSFFQEELVTQFSQQFHKNIMVHQIVKEIFPIIKSLNNTPLGEVANKAIMLEELEKLMEKNFGEFTEDWKSRQLQLEMSKANLASGDKKKVEGDRKPEERQSTVSDKKTATLGRAVDSEQYGDFIAKNKKYPLSRILNIYGVEFFLKVNLRNCNFSYLAKLVNDRQISRRSDLMLLRDMIRTIKLNMDRDDTLKKHSEDIYNLERAVMHNIYFTEKNPH